MQCWSVATSLRRPDGHRLADVYRSFDHVIDPKRFSVTGVSGSPGLNDGKGFHWSPGPKKKNGLEQN